jgi:Ni/Co efflux regulator RcnB
MRTSILAMIVVAGSAVAFPAMAQQQAAPSEQTRDEMQRDADKRLKTNEPSGQMQRDADKGAKTRNSGESGYVADQDKSGASGHAPGRPESQQTTGSSDKKR